MSTQSQRHIPTLLAAFAALPLTGTPMAQMEAISASSPDHDLKTSRVDRTGMSQLPTAVVTYTAKDGTDISVGYTPQSNNPNQEDPSELDITVTSVKRAITCHLQSDAKGQNTAYASDANDPGSKVKIDARFLIPLKATIVKDVAPLSGVETMRSIGHLTRRAADEIADAAKKCLPAVQETIPPTTTAPVDSKHSSWDGPDDANGTYALVRPPGLPKYLLNQQMHGIELVNASA